MKLERGVLFGRTILAASGMYLRGAVPLSQLLYRSHSFKRKLDKADLPIDLNSAGLYEIAEEITGEAGQLDTLIEGIDLEYEAS